MAKIVIKSYDRKTGKFVDKEVTEETVVLDPEGEMGPGVLFTGGYAVDSGPKLTDEQKEILREL